MKAAKRQLKMDPTEESHSNFKRQRNSYFRAIKQSKTNMWNTYVEELTGPDIFKGLQELKPRKTQQTPIINHNGITTSTFIEKANLFRTVMFPTPPKFHPPTST